RPVLAPLPARPPLPVRPRYLKMEAQLHHYRQACSAHRRRVEGARLIVEKELGKLRFLDRQSRRPITRQSRVAGNGEHLYVGCAITSVAVFGGLSCFCASI